MPKKVKRAESESDDESADQGFQQEYDDSSDGDSGMSDREAPNLKESDLANLGRFESDSESEVEYGAHG